MSVNRRDSQKDYQFVLEETMGRKNYDKPRDRFFAEEQGGALFDTEHVSLHEISDHGCRRHSAGSASEQLSGHRYRGLLDDPD